MEQGLRISLHIWLDSLAAFHLSCIQSRWKLQGAAGAGSSLQSAV